jgi:methyl-accepting chemotaxis protein
MSATNSAFGQVSDSADKVADLVGEIAAASGEQSQGAEQVNKAVSEMDKVTQQNAASAEESASASEEMSAQAETMKAMVNDLLAMVGGGQKADGASSSTKPGRNSASQVVEAGRNVKARAKKPEGIQGRQKRPDEVIPLGADDLKDF